MSFSSAQTQLSGNIWVSVLSRLHCMFLNFSQSQAQRSHEKVVIKKSVFNLVLIT